LVFSSNAYINKITNSARGCMGKRRSREDWRRQRSASTMTQRRCHVIRLHLHPSHRRRWHLLRSVSISIPPACLTSLALEQKSKQERSCGNKEGVVQWNKVLEVTFVPIGQVKKQNCNEKKFQVRAHKREMHTYIFRSDE
jgi:hypothetical protein